MVLAVHGLVGIRFTSFVVFRALRIKAWLLFRCFFLLFLRGLLTCSACVIIQRNLNHSENVLGYVLLDFRYSGTSEEESAVISAPPPPTHPQKKTSPKP